MKSRYHAESHPPYLTFVDAEMVESENLKSSVVFGLHAAVSKTFEELNAKFFEDLSAAWLLTRALDRLFGNRSRSGQAAAIGRE